MMFRSIQSAVLMLICAWFSTSAWAEARVSAMTKVDQPDHMELTIFLSEDATYSVGFLSAEKGIPDRMFVDFSQSTLINPMDEMILAENPWVSRVRIAQNQPHRVRLVVELKQKSSQGDFSFHANANGVVISRGRSSSETIAQEIQTPAPGTPLPVVKKPEPSTPVVLQPLPKTHAEKKVYTIIVDPGHGGKHPGAIGKRGTMEKHITLEIAKKLRDLLQKTTPHKILMTREKDEYVDLLDRTKFANRMHGDLFVSIHANSSPKSTAKGVSTYFLNNADDEESLRVATRENGELDPKAFMSHSEKEDNYYLEIMKASMMKNFHTSQSTELAQNVQTSMIGALNTRYQNIFNRGVKSAGLYVLTGAEMPAILVETSFISNPDEEKRLKDPTYPHFLAMAIRSGIVEFLKGYQPSGEKHASLH
ncbi:MAG: N-acetylmuramoyl-L-alanine amidase [Bdellovibrionota bacterium]